MGWAGVQLFFVLSGFLITPILVNLKETHREGYYTHFIIRRAFRIFPLYYFFLLLFIALGVFFVYVSGEVAKPIQVLFDNMPNALSYTYNFFRIPSDSAQFHPLAHIWSLSVEEQFYVIWPFLVLFCPNQHLKKVLVVVVLLGPILRGVTLYLFTQYFSGQTSNEANISHWSARAVYMVPWSHFDAFAIGALVAMLKVPKAKSQFYVLLLVVPVLGLCGQWIANGEFDLTTFGYKLRLEGAYQPIWGYSLLNYVFALLIYLTAREQLFLRVLESAPFKRIGKISYGAYVYHFPIINIVAMMAIEVAGTRDMPLYYFPFIAIFAFIITILISMASFKFIEAPFMRYREKRFGSKRVTA